MVLTRQSTAGGDSSEDSSRAVQGRQVGNVLQVSNDLCSSTPYISSPTPSKMSSFSPSNVSSSSTSCLSQTHLLELPDECIEKIFSYLKYKQISQMRLVSKRFNGICSAMLNSTFSKLQTQMVQRFQSIKAMMPRRESARRNHPLACESDIIETIHMRLTLLQMSFGKHIERNHTCFFAGEILDEVYRILHNIKFASKLRVVRPYRLTDELIDLSSMAMEYFKDQIEPTLPEFAYAFSDFLDFPAKHAAKVPLDLLPDIKLPGIKKNDDMVLQKRIRKLRQTMERYNSQLGQFRKKLRCDRRKTAENQRLLGEYANRMDEYEKKTEEYNCKFSAVLQELNKCKTELQYWRSKTCLTCCADTKVNQGVMPLELSTSALPGPSTSSALQPDWSLPLTFTPVPALSPEQKNKRKSSSKEPAEAPPCKKQELFERPAKKQELSEGPAKKQELSKGPAKNQELSEGPIANKQQLSDGLAKKRNVKCVLKPRTKRI